MQSLSIPRSGLPRPLVRHLVLRSALGLTALLPLRLAAQGEPPNPLTFTGDVGFVNTSGNTSVTSLSIGDKLVSTKGKGKFTQTAALIYSRTSGQETANNQALRVRYDQSVAPRLAVFTFGGYERNKFAGIARRFDEQAGLAFQVLRAARDAMDLEAGLGLVQETRFAQTGSSATASDNFLAGRTAATYKHSFTKTSYFQQLLEYLPNLKTSGDYRINSESALVAPISTHIGLKMSALVRYNNNPIAAGLVKTDRIVNTGLQITF
jgi:putative salt-induced outer membrane protein